MNFWTQKSIEFANSKNYLDELYKIYPMSQNDRRELDTKIVKDIEEQLRFRDSNKLIRTLMELDLFPIKDSYVAYLKRDKTSLERNPQTVDRIASILYDLGFEEVIENCSQPKETNRQIGPLFKYWISKELLGFKVVSTKEEFLSNEANMIFNASDREMMLFASEYLGFIREKGLDFIARINGKYVIGEAKFLTDFGGHQNAQFEDALTTVNTELNANINNVDVIKIAILDGVLYIKGNNKLHNAITNSKDNIILSAIYLRDFLHTI